MKPVHQDQFGNGKGDGLPMGNCFAACVASILEVGLRDVPHFYEIHADNPDNAAVWWSIVEWLQNVGWSLYAIDCGLEWRGHAVRTIGPGLVIGSGESPRFPGVAHAVVGRFVDGEWVTVHDPHPSGDGLTGDPTYVEVLFRLIPAELAA